MADQKQRVARIASLPWETIWSKESIGQSLTRPFAELWSRKDLLRLLIDREIRAKYKGSAFGILWSLAKPLTQLLIYFIAIGQILGAARSIPGFAVFVFVGLTAWSLFSEIVSQSSTAIISNGGIIKKVNVPRELFPLSVVGTSFFNFLIQVSILGLAVLIVGAFPNPADFWILFPAITIIMLFSTGLAYLVSAINVYVRDLQHLIDVAIAVLFWLSPMVYSFKLVKQGLQIPWLIDIYLANPMTVAVLGFQRALWAEGQNDNANFPDHLMIRMAIMIVVGIVFVGISQVVFRRLQNNFAQEI